MAPTPELNDDGTPIRGAGDGDSSVAGTLEAINRSLEAIDGTIEESSDRTAALTTRVEAMETIMRERPETGLSKDETAAFSVGRALRGVLYDDWKDGEMERDALESTRAQATSPDSAGGFLLPTEVQSRILEPLSRRSVAMAAGATMLSGINGTLNLPKGDGEAELQNRSDGAAVSDQSANWTYAQLQMTANYSGEIVKASRSLIQQASPSVDQYLENRLLAAAQRKVDAIALDQILALTGTSDLIADVGAGNKITQRALMRAFALLENNNALHGESKLSFIANPLVKWHILDPNNYSAGAPWLPFPTNQALAAATGFGVFGTTYFNDDTGVNGEAVLGNFENMIIGLFGDGIELASSEHSDFGDNLVAFRVLLAADAVLVHDASFIHWDDLGDA